MNYFLNDVTLYDVLHGDGVSVEDCMNTGKVLIINAPRSNPFVASVVGRLMVAVIFATAMRREAQTMKSRRPVFYLIDEANTYLSSSMASMLLELRKYRVGLVISLQSIKALDLKMKSAITTNTFTKCVSVCDGDSRSFYAKELSVTIEELVKLEPLMFMVKKGDNSSAFRIRVPIVSGSMFLSDEALQKRYKYLIESSGVFRKLPPPAPPPLVSLLNPTPKKADKKKSNDDLFKAQPPAFKS